MRLRIFFRAAGHSRRLWILLVDLLFGLALAACSSPATDLPIPEPLGRDQLDPQVERAFDEIISECERLNTRNPTAMEERVLAYSRLGDLLMAYGQSSRAVEAYRACTELTPNDPSSWLALGHSMATSNRPVESEAAFQRAVELDQGCPSARIGVGRCATSRGELDRAISSFRTGLELDPERADALFELGRIALAHSDLDAADGHLARARRLQPNATPVLYALAMVKRARGLNLEADRLLSWVPSDNRLHIPIAVDDPVINRITDARSDARRFEQRGLRAFAAGRFSLAAVEFRSAVRLDPYRIETRYNLGAALLNLGRNDEAVEVMEAALRLDPEHVPSLVALGGQRLLRNDSGAALELFARAVASDPSSARALRARAGALLATDRPEAALAAFERALELDPSSTEALEGAVESALASGRCDSARRRLDRLTELAHDDPAIEHLRNKVDSCDS